MQSRIANIWTGPESEDCLYLNVWTPAVKGRAAVMVFVHGGAWQIGGANRDECVREKSSFSLGVGLSPEPVFLPGTMAIRWRHDTV